MSRSVAHDQPARHRMSLEDVQPQMAKVDLNPIEMRDFRAEIGRAVARALSLANLSQKEVAALIDVDTAQIARWIAGTERPQFDRLFAIEVLREPLCVALSQMSGAQIEMGISFRRIA